MIDWTTEKRLGLENNTILLARVTRNIMMGCVNNSVVYTIYLREFLTKNFTQNGIISVPRHHYSVFLMDVYFNIQVCLIPQVCIRISYTRVLPNKYYPCQV